jgi:hypothetical protein
MEAADTEAADTEAADSAVTVWDRAVVVLAA